MTERNVDYFVRSKVRNDTPPFATSYVWSVAVDHIDHPNWSYINSRIMRPTYEQLWDELEMEARQ